MKSQTQAQNRNSFDTFANRFRFVRRKLGVSLASVAGGKASTSKSWESGTMPRQDQWEEISQKLGLSVSLLFLGHPKSQADYEFIAKYKDEIAIDVPLKNRLKTGGDESGGRLEPIASSSAVAPRIPLDQRQPSARADCESYFRQLLDAAQAGDNPNAWPVIHDRLKKKFPLEEWSEENHDEK